MIRSREDYRFYLEADRLALNQRRPLPRLMRDHVWRFQRLLREAEFCANSGSGIMTAFHRLLVNYRLQRMSILLGFTIPLNVFGPGLSIAHHGTIVVNSGARVGANCRLHTCVNIGTRAGAEREAPVIGDNVYIGPGAKIFGPIILADGIAIGSNAVVDRSFDEPGITIAGVPAVKVSDRGSEGLLIKATEMLSHSYKQKQPSMMVNNTRE